MSTDIDTNDLSTIPVLGATTTWSLGGNYGYDDASVSGSSVKVRIFAQLVRMYLMTLYTAQSQHHTPLGGHYPSDLLHDGLVVDSWQFTPGNRHRFIFDADAWGSYTLTCLPDGTWPMTHRLARFECEVWAEETRWDDHPWFMSATCTLWNLPERATT